jgi:hypothetical protein
MSLVHDVREITDENGHFLIPPSEEPANSSNT